MKSFIQKHLGLSAGVLVVLFLLTYPAYSSEYWVYYFALIAILSIQSMSFNIALGYTGMVSMAHMSLYCLGAYFTGITMNRLGFPFVLAMVTAFLITGVIGLVISLTSLRTSAMHFCLITYAFNTAIQELAIGWKSFFGGQGGMGGIPRPTISGVRMNMSQYYYVVMLTTIIIFYVYQNLINSRYGRAFRGISASEEAAASLGIRPSFYKSLSFSLACGIVGIAGCLYGGLEGFMSPDSMGGNSSLVLFVGLMLGGSGTVIGPLVGVLCTQLLKQALSNFPQVQSLMFGLLLLCIILLIPKGIVGTVNSIIEAWQEKKKEANLNTQSAHAMSSRTVQELLDTVITTVKHEAGFENFLKVIGLKKHFGGVKALDGVDMTVEGCTIHGLVGPNGSGKSTLMNVVGGVYSKTEGSIVFKGEELNYPQYKVAQKGIVRVFQIPHLFDKMTIMENILTGFHNNYKENFFSVILGLPSYRKKEKELREEALGLIELAGLYGHEDAKVAMLPHGQKRMLEVVRALAVNPTLLMLDEPATGLTSAELNKISELILLLKEKGITILLIEHNMKFVMKLSDFVTVFDDGKKIAEGLPSEVQDNPKVIAAYFGTAGAAAVRSAVAERGGS